MATKRGKAGRIRLDLEERSFYRFSILAGLLARCLAGIYVERFGRPANAWKVLTVVGRFGPMSATEVTHQTSLESDKVTRIVNRLTEQGLVLRRQERTDRRRVTLSLSAKGTRVYDEIERIRYIIEAEFLSVLRPAEREMLYAIMDKLQTRAKDLFDGRQPWRKILDRNGHGLRATRGRDPALTRTRLRAASRAASEPKTRRAPPASCRTAAARPRISPRRSSGRPRTAGLGPRD
jgi:DNA-binding MarR family transcriptional regulator